MTEADYLRPYREAVEHFGPSFEATLWNSRDAQVLRFDVMIDMAALEGAVVIDVGCGTGDLAARLLERGVRFRRYVGIDALAAVIDAARKRDLARCRFIAADVLADPQALADHGADVVCISGTLNTMEERDARRLVATAFEAARRGVVFNFLSTRVDPRVARGDLGPARRFDPVRWIGFALDLSPRVRFNQAYLDGHDATIFVEAPAPSTSA